MPIPAFTTGATVGSIGSAMAMHYVQWAGDCDRLTGRPPLQPDRRGWPSIPRAREATAACVTVACTKNKRRRAGQADSSPTRRRLPDPARTIRASRTHDRWGYRAGLFLPSFSPARFIKEQAREASAALARRGEGSVGAR
jgi:hypothetical protein